MRLNMHKPSVSEVKSIGNFYVIELTDLDGYIDLFVDGDWSHWDRIVAAVDKFREAEWVEKDLAQIELSY